ncbi:hypothetical protein [Chitinophaga defluvii]|uniref:Uncharacterized protein n=1 Tax=Chitinophaga defluvii TaxID=3163343 RepID=A0ABV2TCA5_9BACT
MNPYIPSVHTIALTSIALGVFLFFCSAKKQYNRAVGMTPYHPLPFWQFLIVRTFEFFWQWLYRLLIVFGLLFLLIDWYISPK